MYIAMSRQEVLPQLLDSLERVLWIIMLQPFFHFCTLFF